MSAEQFKSTPEFDHELSLKLQHWNVEPGAIELELTKSVLMETTRQHGEIIDRLHAFGVAIAIDDFGTGYSSLSYLRAYHVNHLKIAQEFVQDIQVDSGDVAIMRAAISLGRELGIKVIAEGVETKHSSTSWSRPDADMCRASISADRSPRNAGGRAVAAGLIVRAGRSRRPAGSGS